jgi:hypothetical protein
MATQNTQKRSGFSGHKNYGAYAGDYVATVKDLSAASRRASPSGTNFNKLQKFQAEQKMKTAIDSGNVDFNMGLVPDAYKAQMKDYILNKAREKGQIELQIERMREGGNMSDPMYQELRMQASQIEQELGPSGSLTKAWTNFNQGAQDFAEDSLEGSISIMSDSANEHANADLYSNSLQLDISNGTLNFGNQDMGFTAYDKFPDYFNADYTNASNIISQSQGIFDKGVKLTGPDKLKYSNNFQEVLRKGGTESVLSLAFDPLITPNESLLDFKDPKYKKLVEIIQGDDPMMAAEAMEELKADLTSSYINVLDTQATNGFNAKNPDGGDGGGDGFFSSFGSFYSAGQFDMNKYLVSQGLEEGTDFATMSEEDKSKAFGYLKDEINNLMLDNEINQYTEFRFRGVDAKGNPKFNFKDRISGTVYKNYSMDRLEKLLNKKIK